MQMGIHSETLAPALSSADIACVVSTSHPDWEIAGQSAPRLRQFARATDCLEYIQPKLNQDDLVVVMSNGNFDGLITQLCTA